MSRSAPLLMAAGLPVALYVATVAGGGYWLDAGELVAAATMLDIAHPPGQPLAMLWGKLWSWLPLGPLQFRVGLGQAVAASAAAAWLSLSIRRCALRLGGLSEEMASTVALAGTWLPLLSYPHWFQAVRPEVYALQGMLLLAAAYGLCVALEPGRRDGRPLYAACLCVGLALTNHHFMAVLFMPALLFVAVVRARQHGPRTIAVSALCGLAGLGVYAYLPARASARPPLNLGDPSNLERFYWVVSARVYSKSVGADNFQPLADRLLGMVVAIGESLHVPMVLVALAGAYLGVRHPRTRHVTLAWLAIALFGFYFSAWVGPARGNPDLLGYGFAAFAAVGLLFALALAAVPAVSGARARAQASLLAVYAALAAGIMGFQVSTVWPRVDLSSRHAVEGFDELRIERLPPRAVAVVTSPFTAFRYFEDDAVARVRPDLQVLALPFLAYPGMAERMKHRKPELAPLIASYVRHRGLRADALLALARARPVMLELDLTVGPAVYRALRPVGLLHEVSAEWGTEADREDVYDAQGAAHAALYGRLGGEVRDVETSRQLLWIHYTNALYFAGISERERALEHALRALALHPADDHVKRLQDALQAWDPDEPFDVRPLLQLD